MKKRNKISNYKDSMIRGVFSLIIGILIVLLAVFLLIFTKDIKVFLCIFVFASIFLIFGIYCLKKSAANKKKGEIQSKYPKVHKTSQAELKKRRDLYLSKVHDHDSLKKMLYYRILRKKGVYLLKSLVFGLILFLAYIPGIVIYGLINFTLLISFLYSLTGGLYRLMLKLFKYFGLDKKMAENEFEKSKVYDLPNGIISVSSQFIMSTETRSLYKTDKVIWAFSGYNHYNQYENKVYTHTEEKYYIVLGLSDGKMMIIPCPEELCSVLINDIADSGTDVVVGYSHELKELFVKDPENFKNNSEKIIETNIEPYGPFNIYDNNKSINLLFESFYFE